MKTIGLGVIAGQNLMKIVRSAPQSIPVLPFEVIRNTVRDAAHMDIVQMYSSLVNMWLPSLTCLVSVYSVQTYDCASVARRNWWLSSCACILFWSCFEETYEA